MDPRRPPLRIRFVLDASVGLSWIFGDHPGVEDFLTEFRMEHSIVPAPWLFEIANGLADGERRQRLTADELAQWRSEIQALLHYIQVEPASGERVLDGIFELSRRHRISAYDASYLELAIREKIALATFDQRLRKAAVAAGVEVLP